MALVKRGRYWHIHFTVNGERVRQSAKTSDRRQAEELEATLKAQAWRGSVMREAQETWDSAVESWLRSTSHRDRSGVEDKIRWLSQFLSGRQLTGIDKSALHSLKDAKLKEGVKPATVNRHMAVVSAVLRHAHTRGWVDAIPPIPRLKEPAGRLRWLSKAEARLLLETLREMPRCGHVADMAGLSLATGLRESNVTGLRWDQVYPGHLLIPQTKSGRALRVPLNMAAEGVLERWRGISEDWVFIYRGKRVRKAGSDGFKAAVRKCGWDDVTWHTLRHTWASWHAQAGTPLPVLQQLGGWSTYQMVLRYSHLAPDYVDSYAGNVGTI